MKLSEGHFGLLCVECWSAAPSRKISLSWGFGALFFIGCDLHRAEAFNLRGNLLRFFCVMVMKVRRVFYAKNALFTMVEHYLLLCVAISPSQITELPEC